MSLASPIAVIGAGIAGLTCASVLHASGREVQVFDKARGPGGRLATRRTEAGSFDHGAPHFRVRDSALQAALAGHALPWQARPGGRDWIGIPAMAAVPRALAAGLTLHCGQAVTQLRRGPDGWHLSLGAKDESGPYAAVVLALPAPQAVPLLDGHPHLQAVAAGVRYAPCWTLMFTAALAPPENQAQPAEGPLAWLAREASKPGRAPGERWVAQATAGWSQAQLQAVPEAVSAALLGAVAERWSVHAQCLTAVAVHRWLYARVQASAPGLHWDASLGLGLCGDGYAGDGVEAAFGSGLSLAQAIAVS